MSITGDTVTAIDFIRMARIYAPPGNNIIQNMLLDYEKIFLELLLQLSRQDEAQAMTVERPLSSKTKSKKTFLIDYCNDPHRDDFKSGGRLTQMSRQEKILAYFKARMFFCSLDTQAPKGNEVVFSYLKKINESILAELFGMLKTKKDQAEE